MSDSITENINKLLDIMKQLRNPNGGCPWDLEQDFDTISHHTIEEAYEVADAIERKNMDDLKDELGDLLFQVIFHAQIASEKGLFDFNDVVKKINDKMIFRHPHIFGDNSKANNADEVTDIWETQKAKEAKSKNNKQESILDNVTNGLPPLIRAYKLQEKAAKVGFEWQEISSVLDKLDEEIQELKQAINESDNTESEKELGDVFFVLVNIARMLKISPEKSLIKTNMKFYNRFKAIEKEIKSLGRNIEDCSLEEMDAIWNKQKRIYR